MFCVNAPHRRVFRNKTPACIRPAALKANKDTSAAEQIGRAGEYPSWKVEKNSLKANEPVMCTSSRKYVRSCSRLGNVLNLTLAWFLFRYTETLLGIFRQTKQNKPIKLLDNIWKILHCHFHRSCNTNKSFKKFQRKLFITPSRTKI